MNPSVFSRLPVELVRLILEASGRDCSKSAARLLRVSRLVHSWILPIVYETLVIDITSQRSLRACRDITRGWHMRFHPGPLSFFDSLKNICLSTPNATGVASYDVFGAVMAPGITRDQQQDILCLFHDCTNISNLYIDISLDNVSRSGTLSPKLGAFGLGGNLGTSLTHLHCGSWDAWMSTSRYLADLPSLTHLRIDVAYNTGIFGSFLPLVYRTHYLSRLSHFAVAFDSRSGPHELRGAADFADSILRRPHIKSVVLMAWYCWETTRGRLLKIFGDATDPRLTILEMGGCADVRESVKEWEAGVRGKGGIWNEVTQQKKGENFSHLNQSEGIINQGGCNVSIV